MGYSRRVIEISLSLYTENWEEPTKTRVYPELSPIYGAFFFFYENILVVGGEESL
jgi:hypothetical protein